MPPDIMAAPSVLTGGTTAGRALSAAGIGPPGNDPLAALFAALLAQSGGPTTSAGLALLKPKAGALPITDDTFADSRKDKTATDKSPDKTIRTALPVLPPPLLPISMRMPETKPILLPTAGVTAGQKTMDTASMPTSPSQETVSVKSSSELTLRKTPTDSPAASPTFPALLIPALSILAPPTPISAPIDPIATVPQGAVITATLPLLSLAGVNEPRAAVAAAPFVPKAQLEAPVVAANPALPSIGVSAIVSPTLLALPKTFAVTPVVIPELPPSDPLPVAATAGSVENVVVPTPTTPVYVAAPQGFAVKPETMTASVPNAPLEQAVATVPTAPLPTVVPALTALLGTLAPSNVVAPKSTEGKTATDGKITTDGVQATEGSFSILGARPVPSVPLGPAMPVNVPEKGLKSAGIPADNNTRTGAAPAQPLPTELTLQVIGKRSERREPGGDDAAATVLTGQAAPTGMETARTEAKPLTPADRAEMVRQIADGVGAMRLPTQPGKADQMTLQLHPKDWGQVQISVKITPGSQPGAVQTVTAHIIAETPQVKAALESQSGDLRQALRKAGLNLDKMTVTVQNKMNVTVQSAAAGAHAGTASGGHQGMNDGGFSKPPDQQTGMSNDPSSGMPSFAAFAGHSQGGRQGGQPSAPTAFYPRMEPDREELFEAQAPRRLPLGQVDMRA